MILLSKKRRDSLFTPIDCSSLGLFRICIGLTFIYQSFFVFTPDFIKHNVTSAYYHFPFPIFEYLHLPTLPAGLVYQMFNIMGLAALGITLGLFYRLSLSIYCAGLNYLLLWDRGLYVEDYYLSILICILLFVTQSNRWPFLKELRPKSAPRISVPYWQIFILRFQFGIVFFFSALSKLNYDWLILAEPLQNMLSHKIFLGVSLDNPIIAYLFSYAGLFFVFALSFIFLTLRGARWGILILIVFNVANHWLFEGDIGSFPFLMLSSFALLLNPATPRKFLTKTTADNGTESSTTIRPHPITMPFLLIYMLIQLLIPLRHYLYPGKSAWTFEGVRFSWHLKLNTKKVKLQYRVVDLDSGREFFHSPYLYLTPRQQWLDNIPDMIHQYAHYLKNDFKEHGFDNVAVYAQASASYNNRHFQTYIDPTVDLTRAPHSMFSHAAWIVPFENTQPLKY